MQKELYSVEEVAGLLGLHVRTVRNYVREGRLKATRIGKQYRIAAADLEAMTGRAARELEPAPVRRNRYVEVSSIVDIDAIGQDQAIRLVNALTSAPKSRPQSDDPFHLETMYNEERAALKVILTGSLGTVASFLQFIGFYLEAQS